MRWKHNYIVGMTVMSMFFTLPLVSAEEEEVIVYGDEFETGDETATTEENSPTDEGNTAVETPEEQINEPENTTNTEEGTTENGDTTDTVTTTEPEDTTYSSEESQNEPSEETPVEKVNSTEEQETVEEENPEVEVENSNPIDNDTNDNYDENSSSDEGNNNDDSTVETETPAAEDTTTEVEGEPLSTETPVDNNPTVEENTVYPEYENLGEDVETDLTKENENETTVPIENTTIGYDEGTYDTTGSYNEHGNDEGEYTNVKTPVTNGNITNPLTEETTTKSNKTKTEKTEKEKKLKTQKARFVKLLSDDTYEYYLDRSAVRWVNMPYSTSEYMADVWIRMIEKYPSQTEDMPSDMYQYLNSGGNEISDAAEKGLVYNEVDEKVLRSRKYFLEHYYIRPKTRQIQFLCELEVIGRPQNAISERPYEYKNWENLIPGSVESYIYSGTLAEIGTSKSNKRGHMTVVDMLDEYARIALN